MLFRLYGKMFFKIPLFLFSILFVDPDRKKMYDPERKKIKSGGFGSDFSNVIQPLIYIKKIES